MDFLLHNPIGDMRGQYFALLYLGIVLGAILWLVSRRNAADVSAELPPLQVPPNPDPYQIACLRGGENELARLTLLSLIERGYLEIDAGNNQIRRCSPHPEAGPLLPHEQKIFEWCWQPRDAKDLFNDDDPKMAVRTAVSGYEQWFRRERLLWSDESRERLWQSARNAMFVIVGLGGYKLLVALAKGRSNLAFLTVIGLGGCLAVFLVYRTHPRLSARGQEYLKSLRGAFDGLKPVVAEATAGSVNPALLLGVAVFGSGLLAGTMYDNFRRVYQRGATGASSGCGSSCGSGSDGGSDSGSSCSGGGDGGGGGCGGCGGGGE